MATHTVAPAHTRSQCSVNLDAEPDNASLHTAIQLRITPFRRAASGQFGDLIGSGNAMRHGGEIPVAADVEAVNWGDWLDLSTGIAPVAYPYTPPAPDAWQRLPQRAALDGLLDAARAAYGATASADCVAAPGTQIIIQLLPQVVTGNRVAVVGPTYFEHARCWAAASCDVERVDTLEAGVVAGTDVVVLTNPNNPDGRSVPARDVIQAADAMAERGGLLVVDEAFADVVPEVSVASAAGREGLIVLRSFGKFYGLAGVRLGFALGHERVTSALASLMGAWHVSGPALVIGREALADRAWAEEARLRYREASDQLDEVLERNGLRVVGGTTLFRLALCDDADALHEYLGSERILTRRFPEIAAPRNPGWLRFGLPPDTVALTRLDQALSAFK